MLKRVTALVLSLFLICGAGAAALGAEAEVMSKDEVIYARLSAAGEALNVYVVNRFDAASPGVITDYGDYSGAVNLTGLEPIELGEAVTFETASDSFYYQGYLNNTDLPWIYDIGYKLDGADIAPEELAGRSGRLELRLAAVRNEAVDDTFYNNFMQQITITLDTQRCKNIEAPGASQASVGKNRALVFTVLPGSDADITVSADADGFEMAGIDIAAMPFTMNFNLPDTSGMTAEFQTLADALNELDEGVGALKDGAGEMKAGAEALAAGSSEFNGGLARLDEGSAQLVSASSQIMEGLTAMYEGVAAIGFLTQFSDGLAELNSGYSVFHDGIVGYTGGVTALAENYAQLNDGVSGLSGGAADMDAGIAELREGTAQLAAGTADISERIQEQIDALISEFTGEGFVPKSFTSDKNQHVGLVQFVFKTAGVEKPAPPPAASAEETQPGFFERLARLFTGR
ncbi:MAG: hypothetical protein LBS19_14690 [Clostridiales bacterium]|jgi:X-X-X-Leu-X-X-Gly heptad repeat protein|nr:hypothetical protein [Clostridiales bacterium]